jgi:putative hemolysin
MGDMAREPETTRLIDLQEGFKGPLKRSLFALVKPSIEALLSVNALNAVYNDIQEHPSTDNFFLRALRSLEVGYEVADEDLARIPKEGAVLAVSNHPYGGLDGIVLGAVLCSVRPDVRLLANYLLGRMTEMRPWLLAVDPFGRADSARQNLRAMKETVKFLREGGCVGAFPSGTVSHIHLKQRQVTDPAWSPHVARLLRASTAMALPVFFEGNNSAFFQIMGLMHPLMRTALLPRELIRKRFQSLRVRVGNPIPFRKLADFPTDEALTEFLRLNTYLLRDRAGSQQRKRFPVPLPKVPAPERKLAPLAPVVPAEELTREMEALSPEQMLVESGQFVVYHARAPQIPRVLEELGRLREMTFREVNEGTGNERDLDEFDPHYNHLIMWDREARAIVGAYRFALTDEVYKTLGVEGLYTSTLFKYKPEFLEMLGPAIELGRSFIVSAYQRKQASLIMIWRGIGQLVVRNPRYKTLFGPVSINPDYQTVSKDLMVQFLRQYRFDDELSNLVKPKRPPRKQKLRGAEVRALLASVRDIDDVSALVSEIETDKKGVPILLRHYLKMNGRLISFNVDPAFGKCLDGLIMVDLTKSDPKLLRAYLTPQGAESFLAFQKEKAGGNKPVAEAAARK